MLKHLDTSEVSDLERLRVQHAFVPVEVLL